MAGGDTEEDALAWLRLARAERIGPATFLQLLRRFGSADAAIDALPEIAARAGCPAPRVPSPQAAEKERAAGVAMGATLLRLGRSGYPALLAEIDPPPPCLWALGDPSRLVHRAVAVVGARNASALGQRFAGLLASALAETGALVVSGLARGVDAAAHRAALGVGGGTASVVAGGVDHIYPPENADLREAIAREGALVSEMPIGFQPTAGHFRRRNRLISGLALGVVVVEGGERSGSLTTASDAADQGREVLAAPGHPLDARAAGCNRLIREGATLIRSAEDVLEALDARLREPPPAPAGPIDADAPTLFETSRSYTPPSTDSAADDRLRARILAALSVSPIPLDALVRALDAPEGAVLWALTELEVAGLARRDIGGTAALATP